MKNIVFRYELTDTEKKLVLVGVCVTFSVPDDDPITVQEIAGDISPKVRKMFDLHGKSLKAGEMVKSEDLLKILFACFNEYAKKKKYICFAQIIDAGLTLALPYIRIGDPAE